MTNKFSQMPIEDSPWVDVHDPDDVENYIGYFHGLATSIVDLLDDGDTRISGPFLSGAQQSVERYNVTTRAHKMTKQTTFRFSQLKEGERPTTVFIIPDPSRLEAQKPILELLQYCMFQELKRHPNTQALVHIIGDEANNFLIKDLDSLLTWGRGYGLRFQLYIQNFPAFRKLMGKDALATLQSESEIILFLPGQREAETLSFIEKKLGERGVIAEGQNGNIEAQKYKIGGTDYKEDGRPLMTTDEVRRTEKGILFIRRNKPMQVDLPPIAAIEPFRSQIDINPLHGKPFLLPTVLTLDRDNSHRPSFLRRMLRKISGTRKRELKAQKFHLKKLAKRAWLASTLINSWALIALIAMAVSPIGPHIRWSYQSSQYGSNNPNSYSRCVYMGSRGFVMPDMASRCPLLVFIDSRPWR